MRSVVLLILLAFTLGVYLTASFGSGLLDDADAGHAEVSKEILEGDNWVTLHMNGIRFLEKGPLMFWMGAISIQYLGVTELAIRAVAVFCILGTVLVCYAFAAHLSSLRAGFYAGFAFAAGWGVFLFTRAFIPDILITLTIALAMLCYWRSRTSLLYAYGFWAALAAAVLGKGLIGIVFPLGAIALYILITRRWRDILTLRPLPGIAFFLLLAAPWHIIASYRTPKFAWFYFINEHYLRFLGRRIPMDYDTVPLIPFWLMLLLWLFPFSVFLPLAFRKSENSPDKPKLFLGLWALVVMCFFSLSTRQEYYTMPAWPPLAILIGLGMDRAETESNRWMKWLQAIPALLGVLAAAALGALLWVSRGVKVQGDISTLLSSNPDMYRLSLGHMFDLQQSTFAALRIPAAGAGLVLSIGFVYALVMRIRNRHTEATILTAVTSGLFLLCAHLAFMAFEPYLSSRPLARAIEKLVKKDDIVVVNGEYYNASSLGFYLTPNVTPKLYLLNGRMTGLEFGSHYPDAPKLFLEDADIVKRWSEPQRVFLFTDGGDQRVAVEKLLPAGAVHVIAASGGKFILSNHAN